MFISSTQIFNKVNINERGLFSIYLEDYLQSILKMQLFWPVGFWTETDFLKIVKSALLRHLKLYVK